MRSTILIQGKVCRYQRLQCISMSNNLIGWTFTFRSKNNERTAPGPFFAR